MDPAKIAVTTLTIAQPMVTKVPAIRKRHTYLNADVLGRPTGRRAGIGRHDAIIWQSRRKFFEQQAWV